LIKVIWDPFKAAKVLADRGLDFATAIIIFQNPHLLIRSDKNGEVRWKATGRVEGQMLTVIFTQRDEAIRIITLRRAWRNEERAFGELHSR
jgi:uncharacterized protein